MSKHYFKESSGKFGIYHRVIYCEWCGVVVWDFNKNDRTTPTIMDLQEHAEKPCNASQPTPIDKRHTEATE